MIIESDYSLNADLNEDGELNVVDIVVLINLILDLNMVADATNVNYFLDDGIFQVVGNGYIGAVQLKISHDPIFFLELTDNALVADFKTNDQLTTIVIVHPSNTEIFRTDDNFKIEEILVTNSQEIINVNIPTHFELNNPYPNPFNSMTNIKFSLPTDSSVKLKVYNLLGKEITTLIDKEMESGFHNIVWDADLFSSGVYFVKLVANNSSQNNKIGFSQTQKIILLK